jgi:predicted dehydrogenase
MEKKIIKYGVVGLKRGADIAVEGRGFENAKFCAACDHNPETLASAKARIQANFKDCVFYSDLDEMLKSDIDAVIVATEAIYHVPIVKKVMEAGKHVLSEIPSVNTLEEAYELKSIVSSHPDLIYMAGENCCYWAFIETWKKMREQGDFGDVVYVEGDYLHAGHPDKFDPNQYKLPDGTLHWRAFNPAIKYITHELGPILYILDDRCVSVTCFEPDVIYNPYVPERKSNGVALIKTAKGAVIRVFICFGAYVGAEHKFRLFGTRGNIVTDNTTMGTTKSHSFATLYSVPESNKEKLEIPVTTVYEGEDASTGHGGADRKMLADFISCVAEGRTPVLDVDFAINMSLPGILAHESAVQGGVPIEIPRF